MNSFSRKIYILLASIPCVLLTTVALLHPAGALAQDRCQDLSDDEEWTEGIRRLHAHMQNKDMHAAKVQARALSEICANSPTLNYLQGKISESLGESKEALYFYQKASENTYYFAVDPDTAKLIWYTRYENEHPERTEGALTTTNARMDELGAEAIELRNEKRDIYRKLLWTGTGIGIGGLILTAVGGAVVASTKPVSLTEVDGVHYKYQAKSVHSFGWTSLGIGSGLLMTGAVLAGVFGYKYRQSDPDKENITFNISPMNFSIQMQF